MKLIRIAALVGALAVTAFQPAQATIITQTFSGLVTFVDVAHDFGLKSGDVLSASVTFDTSKLAGVGSETQTPTDFAGLDLHVTLGTLSFDEHDDHDFPGFPRLDFSDGKLVNINFQVLIDSFVFFMDDGAFRITGRDLEAVVSGTFSTDPAAVPEPATLAMLGIGLGAVACARRRRSYGRGTSVPLATSQIRTTSS